MRGGGPSTGRRAPQHLAGAPRPHAPYHLHHDDPAALAKRARVQRSRLAIAVSATLAALPILVIDNLSATAGARDEVATESATSESSATFRPLVTLPPTSTTTPPTTEAPPTTTTTEAPTTTEAVVEVEAAAAPPPTSPPTTAAPATTVPPATETSSSADPNDPATWDRLAQCESGGNWSMNSGNGYYGGLQFSLATWQAVGGSGYPHQASRTEQISRGQRLYASQGWSPWPYCARQLGY